MIFPFIAFLIAKPNKTAFFIGLPLCICGELIRIWSAGYLKKLDVLTTAGPFAMCRNPLYVGSFFGCSGYYIMSDNIIIWISGPILFWLFHFGAVLYEEGLLQDMFGDSFKEYCKRVPRFVPKSLTLQGIGQFSWTQFIRNSEYSGMITMTIIISAFALVSFVLHRSPIELIQSR